MNTLRYPSGPVPGLGDGERGRRRLLPGLQPDDGHKQYRGLQVGTEMCARIHYLI